MYCQIIIASLVMKTQILQQRAKTVNNSTACIYGTLRCIFGTGAVRVRYWCGAYSVLVRCAPYSVLSRFACGTMYYPYADGSKLVQ